MISVRTPAARARAMIARGLPPSERLRYQIHIERPRMGKLDAVAVAGHLSVHDTSAVATNKTAAVAFLGRSRDTPCRSADSQLETIGELSAAATRASRFAGPRATSGHPFSTAELRRASVRDRCYGQAIGLGLVGFRHASTRAGSLLRRIAKRVYLPISPGLETRISSETPAGRERSKRRNVSRTVVPP